MFPLRDEILSLAKSPAGARITIVRPGALGDTILLLPTVQMLRDALPGCRITVVGSPWAERLAPLMPHPWEFFPFESPRLASLFTPAGSGDVPDVLLEADVIVVYTADARGPFVRNIERLCNGLVISWPVDAPAGTHAGYHFAAALAERPPAPEQLPLPSLHVSDEARRKAQRRLAEHLDAGAASVLIHPGSGGKWKCWPADRFAELARRLGAAGARVVLLKGPADERACQAMCEHLLPDNLPPVLAESENLEDAAALISCADLYVGNDSGITHMAAALGVPTLAVFGPTDPAMWRPLGREAEVVRGVAADDNPAAWPAVEDVLGAALPIAQAPRR